MESDGPVIILCCRGAFRINCGWGFGMSRFKGNNWRSLHGFKMAKNMVNKLMGNFQCRWYVSYIYSLIRLAMELEPLDKIFKKGSSSVDLTLLAFCSSVFSSSINVCTLIVSKRIRGITDWRRFNFMQEQLSGTTDIRWWQHNWSGYEESSESLWTEATGFTKIKWGGLKRVGIALERLKTNSD